MRRPVVSILFAISCGLVVTAAEAQPVADLPLTCPDAGAIGQQSCSNLTYESPTNDQLIVLRGSGTWARAASIAAGEAVAVCSLPVEPGTYSNCRDGAGTRRIVYRPKTQIFSSLPPQPPPAPPSFANILTLDPTRAIEITAPGVYLLNRNWVTGPNGPGILISADDVTLDLQGFEYHGEAGGIVSNGRNVVIRNGRVSATTAFAITSFGPSAVIHDLRVHVDVGTAISLLGAGSLLHDSTVTVGEGLSVRAHDDTIVRNNRLEGRRAVALEAIRASRTLITDNQFVACGSGAPCVHIEGNNNIFSRNKVTALAGSTVDGVVIVGNFNDAQDNVLIHCGAVSGSNAMSVSGQWNTLRGNLMPRCSDAFGLGWSVGIGFGQAGNFYGDNIVWALRPFELNGTVQTDLGGNVGFSQ
jgi:hypothetical protein